MPYNTKKIKRDSQNIPVPQIFDPAIDDFSPLTGVDLGGGRVGADNLMWGKTAGGLLVPIKVSDTGEPLVQLTGSSPEVESAQDTNVVGTAETYNRAVGASRMEVYCETGYIRVRTDGQPCTSTTGEPIAAGFAACWNVESVSIYYIQESIITVVSR